MKEYNRRESCELEKTIEGLIEKKVKKGMEGLQDDTNEKLKQYFSRVEECYKYLLRMEGPHCQLETRLGQLEARI